MFRGGAAFSFPVGDMFGIQADLTALDAFGETAIGGAVHAFTRDPNSYLFGVYGGYTDAGSANIWHVGPEAELYLDNISIEAVGGYMDIERWRPAANFMRWVKWRFMLLKTCACRLVPAALPDFKSANAGLEWFMGDTGIPASLTVDGRIGEDGFSSVMAGLSLYFGGEDKSLIRRHREDDPRIHSLTCSMPVSLAAACWANVMSQNFQSIEPMNVSPRRPILHKARQTLNTNGGNLCWFSLFT